MGCTMRDEHTTAVVQRYLDELAGDSPAEPIVRPLLDRAVRRLNLLCATLLLWSYSGLTLLSLNLQTDDLLGAVAERLSRPCAKSASGSYAVVRAGQPARARRTQ
jgi:RNA polymerase sigma-70 factor (ECF subfamily)